MKHSKINSIALLMIVLSGCNAKPYIDVRDKVSSSQLNIPVSNFESIAWLNEDHITFIYESNNLDGDKTNKEVNIGVFEISTNTMLDLVSSDSTPYCRSGSRRISDLSRITDNFLGFIFHCSSGGDVLYILNIESKEIIKRQTYLDFTARSFSFSPDLLQIVQENGNGGGLSEELILISSDGSIKRLLSDFQRARSPSWSADGKTIAFAGNYASIDGVKKLFLSPWDIYLMNADGTAPRVLVPSVGIIYGLKWSPANKDLLLFGGSSFDNADGVWLLDTSNLGVQRIWDKNTEFDWSPDGSKVVLLDNQVDTWWTKILIIDVSDLVSSIGR